MTTKLGWFTSGNGRGSRNLFYKALHRYSPKTFSFVLITKEEGETEYADEIIVTARSNDIPVLLVPNHGDLGILDRAVCKLVRAFGFDIGVMAGYQHIAPQLCSENFIINVHPDIPGRYVGHYKKVIGDILYDRVHVGGVFVHRAGDIVDVGEVFSQMTFPISDEDMNYGAIRAKMIKLEGVVLLDALDKLIGERDGN